VAAVEGDPYLGLVVADKYRLDTLIGEGAMGRVYRGEQLTLGKPFAVKILAPHLTHDEQSQQRFANEAHNAASLNHPNCVSVVDYGRTPTGVTYIVMEYIEGKSLESLIHEAYPLPRDRITDLTLQILAALTEAHGMGILHRDLKPENILVQTLRTRGELAKVLDFGIAKLMDPAPGTPQRTGLTNQGVVCGTPEYMSPEQARGQRLDPRSDLYAVGVILYQMLTGRPPFESASAVEILHKHLHEPPVPPSTLLGRPADGLEAICLKALAKEPDERFASANAFRDALVAVGTQTAGDRTIACTHCGASVRADARFCSACGTPVATPDALLRSSPAPRRAPPTRRSGLHPVTSRGDRESTAEVVVRLFPLPLAERDEVLERARQHLATPRAGLLPRAIGGASGTGKTRVLDELATIAETEGWVVYYVGSDPSGTRTPLWPIQRMVAQAFGLDALRLTTRDLGRAANVSGLHFEELPGLAELFGLVDGPAHDMEHRARQRECYASATRAMLAAGRGEPLLLLFDDVEGWDRPSREVLQRLMHAECEVPVMVVAASAEPDLAWLSAPVALLQPLGPEAIARSCAQLTVSVNPDSDLPARLAGQGPKPALQLEMLLRLAADGVEAPPHSDERVLAALRIASLPPRERAVLQCAAVIGDRFGEPSLVSALHRTQPQLAASPWQLDEALAELHVRGLLVITGRDERAFTHRTIRRAVLDTLEPPLLVRLHAAVIDTVDVQANFCARIHHQLGASRPEALQSLLQGAELAERFFDDRRASAFVQRAQQLCAELDPGDPLRFSVEAQLATIAARVMREAGEAEHVIDLLRRIDARRLPATEAGHVHRSEGQALLRLGRFDEAIAALHKALAPAMASGDVAGMLATYEAIGQAHARAGRLDRALAELREGLDLCTSGEGPRATTELSLWRYLLAIAQVQRSVREHREAQRFTEHALWQAEHRGDELGQLRCHARLAALLAELRQGSLAEGHLARALDHARYFGDRLTTAELLLERARLRAASGRVEEARRACEEALALSTAIAWQAGIEHAKRSLALLGGAGDDPRRLSSV
jgi:serine/threonine-protein kinase